ncbi:MAG: hypothetical protein ACYDAR_18580 [Thermomicrobiales bacterium]
MTQEESQLRDLTSREREVLRWLASQHFPGHTEVLSQIAAAKVKRQWGGDPTIELSIDTSIAKPAEHIEETGPVVAVKETPDTVVTVSIIMGKGGYIDLLEIVPYKGEVTECPPVDELRIVYLAGRPFPPEKKQPEAT